MKTHSIPFIISYEELHFINESWPEIIDASEHKDWAILETVRKKLFTMWFSQGYTPAGYHIQLPHYAIVSLKGYFDRIGFLDTKKELVEKIKTKLNDLIHITK